MTSKHVHGGRTCSIKKSVLLPLHGLVSSFSEVLMLVVFLRLTIFNEKCAEYVIYTIGDLGFVIICKLRCKLREIRKRFISN